MKKNRRILAFMLCMGLLLRSNLGAWASEPPKESPDAAGESQEADDEEATADRELSEYIKEAQEELDTLASKENLMALVYLCDTYQVKKTPDNLKEVVAEVPSGTTVLIKGMEVDKEDNIWYRVSFELKGNVYAGYIERSYLAYSNELLIQWENNYFPQTAVFTTLSYPDVEQFPASYQQKLLLLKQSHPNWIFVKQNTKLEWQSVVNNENYKDRSLISSSMGAAYRGEYYGSGWYYASEEAVKYYLDPRNFLNETRVFQFEQLTYNSSYHTQSAVQNILNNTFMKAGIPGASMTYAEAFFQIGASLKVSPFHLACRVYQEQGEGTSALISGNYDAVPEYKGYYNYYNIGASGSTTKQIVESGLAKAVAMGWNTPYASIKGGAEILSKNYILRGQDTLYLQKFDVDASDGTLYTHQYMQNIMAPYSESSMVKSAYAKTGSLDSPFVFKIPVYNNMPFEVCPVPGQSAAPTATARPTATASATPTATARPTATASATPTAAPTATPTATASATPTATPTATASATPTATPTATARPTATAGATPTATARPTATASATPAATPTATVRPTATAGATPTATARPTATAGATPTATARPTATAGTTPAATPTARPIATATASAVPAAKPTVTQAPTSRATTAPISQATGNPEAVPSANVPVATSTISPEGVAATREPAAVNAEKNTGSAGMTVVAVTPKPQTASEDKDILVMDISKTGMIYAQTLQQIKEQGREVILEINDQISWKIEGSKIDSGSFKDVNLKAVLGSSQIPEHKLEALTENESYIELSLAHEGEFGFTAVLSVQLDNGQPGQYANLFYYNEEIADFEFMCASLINSKGIADFEFKHTSDYVIIISDNTKENLLEEKAKAQTVEAMAQTQEELPAKEPGKAAGMLAIILLASIALGIGAYLIFKKNGDE